MTADVKARFWAKVQKTDGCWIWTAARTLSGYGLIGARGGRLVRAHRMSWMIHRRNIPAGKHVLHRCDNPPCVNPEHLFLGSHRDNMRDMAMKNRQRKRAVAKKGVVD